MKRTQRSGGFLLLVKESMILVNSLEYTSQNILAWFELMRSKRHHDGNVLINIRINKKSKLPAITIKSKAQQHQLKSINLLKTIGSLQKKHKCRLEQTLLPKD
eukprot:421727_1